MRELYLYIDGENLSSEAIIQHITTIKKDMKTGDKLIGKLYGGRDQVKNIVPFCLINGLSYVETSVLSTAKKNVADMKIIVDCMFDISAVLNSTTGNSLSVCLLTNDNDFMPLIYKLCEMDVFVNSPLINSNDFSVSNNTTANLDACLKQEGFYSPRNSDCMCNLFNTIKKITKNTYTDDVIDDHIRFRTRKFISFLEDTFDKSSMYNGVISSSENGLYLLDPRNFSFYNIVKCFIIPDEKVLDLVYTTYIRKVFGFIPKIKSAPTEIVEQIKTAQIKAA